MRIFFIVLTVIFFGTCGVWAETVNLTDGRSVQGAITKRDAKSIEINTDGVVMTYYADEIKDIDGQPFSAPAAEKVAEPAAGETPPAVVIPPAAEASPTAPANAQAQPAVEEPPTAPANAETQPAVEEPPTAPANAQVQPAVEEPPTAPANAQVQPAVEEPPTVPTSTQPAAVNPQVPEPVNPSPAVQPTLPVGNPGAVTPEKKALILKFIEVFGTRQALINNFDVMLKQIEKDKPDEAKKIRDRVKVDEIIDRLLPVYERNFTTEDLQSFIAFYGSPEGKKLIKTIPILMRESVGESVKYMEEKFPESKTAKST